MECWKCAGIRNGNVVQNNCIDTLEQILNRNGCSQPEEDNFHCSDNQFENESEGNFSPNIEGVSILSVKVISLFFLICLCINTYFDVFLFNFVNHQVN